MGGWELSKNVFAQTATNSKSIDLERSALYEHTLRPRFARVRGLIEGLLEAALLEFLACLWTLWDTLPGNTHLL